MSVQAICQILMELTQILVNSTNYILTFEKSTVANMPGNGSHLAPKAKLYGILDVSAVIGFRMAVLPKDIVKCLKLSSFTSQDQINTA